MSRGLVLFSFGVSAAIVVVACTTDYQQGLDDPNYGAPNALAGQQPPAASEQVGSSSGGSSGATTNTTAPVCVTKNNGTLVDGGTCTVSWSKDILTAFVAPACASTSCHGASATPVINTSDPNATYTAFAQYVGSTGKPYIDPCSINPDDSEIAFNFDPTADATKKGQLMPQGSATGVPALVTPVTTWVKCGAPNN